MTAVTAANVTAEILDGEKPLSLEEARLHPLLARRGNRPSLPTLHRWCRDGLLGVRLEVIRRPSGLTTTAACIERFIARLTAAQQRRQRRREAAHA